MTKRFERIYADVDVFCRDHNAKGISQLIEKDDYDKIVDLLNELHEENKQLKQIISKIDFAIISKYDNSLENLLDEVYNGEYNNWIQKQVLRAKKLEKGDME